MFFLPKICGETRRRKKVVNFFLCDACPDLCRFFGIISGALLLLFCYSITGAVRRWLKTQAAAEI
jgi:hypothetical protein